MLPDLSDAETLVWWILCGFAVVVVAGLLLIIGWLDHRPLNELEQREKNRRDEIALDAWHDEGWP